ncbi:hypothetical protein WJ542_08005 [Paraburkholderia sp. B3]|uniref:hypothetical protein n=1 Tax=Paraburkholderia sp. B3 TaxID=3134791 RepID=UPI003982945C
MATGSALKGCNKGGKEAATGRPEKQKATAGRGFRNSNCMRVSDARPQRSQALFGQAATSESGQDAVHGRKNTTSGSAV